jgi:glycosyltransferase involved in cell wall biosynthesis
MWNGRTVAVVLPTFRERNSIAAVVKGFEALGIVDDIVVVNNNAEHGTSAEVAATSAREIFESTQGYGSAIQRGLREVDADLICVCEPDATFNPEDLLKLLPYSVDCDAVFGSRTVSTFIWSGANMNWFLRWGNWAVAKMIEVLYNTPYLSDVGCTYRLLSRECVARIQPEFRSHGSRFGLEMQLLVVATGERFVQVPVNYHPRVGESAVTGDLRKALALGIDMIGLVLRMRIGRGRLRTKRA